LTIVHPVNGTCYVKKKEEQLTLNPELHFFYFFILFKEAKARGECFDERKPDDIRRSV
jgi:hypothetical protein